MRNKEKGIIRVDRNYNHGFRVQLYFKGKSYSKLFSDGKWGGRDKAWEKAILWRNEKKKEIGKIRSNEYVSGSRSTNTGVCGIREIRKKYTDKQGRLREEHVLQITVKKYGTSVSIRSYGYENAMERAIRKKEEFESRLRVK